MRMPTLYRRMYDRGVFTTREAAEALKLAGAPLHEKLSRLSAEGYFRPVRRGLYAVVPPHQRAGVPLVNPYLVASKLADPYVLGYHTALELHGAAHSSFHQVTVASPATFRTFTYQDVTYRRVSATPQEVERSRTRVVVEDQDVHVAKREWALVQGARRLDLCGGLEELLRSVEAFPSLDLDEVKDALRALGYATLYNRVGFILSYHRRLWRLTDEDLADLRKATSAHRQYFGADPPAAGRAGRAVLVPAWNVLVPAHLAGGDAAADGAA